MHYKNSLSIDKELFKDEQTIKAGAAVRDLFLQIVKTLKVSDDPPAPTTSPFPHHAHIAKPFLPNIPPTNWYSAEKVVHVYHHRGGLRPACYRRGLQIELRLPEDDTVFQADEPVTVHLEFLSATDGTEPDMETLEVEVRQKRAFGLWLGKDMTDEIRPYIEGTAVRIPKGDFKGYTGDFRFFVRIQDQQGRENEAQFSLTVEA